MDEAARLAFAERLLSARQAELTVAGGGQGPGEGPAGALAEGQPPTDLSWAEQLRKVGG